MLKTVSSHDEEVRLKAMAACCGGNGRRGVGVGGWGCVLSSGTDIRGHRKATANLPPLLLWPPNTTNSMDGNRCHWHPVPRTRAPRPRAMYHRTLPPPHPKLAPPVRRGTAEAQQRDGTERQQQGRRCTLRLNALFPPSWISLTLLSFRSRPSVTDVASMKRTNGASLPSITPSNFA